MILDDELRKDVEKSDHSLFDSAMKEFVYRYLCLP
jgi:hypothetical protein